MRLLILLAVVVAALVGSTTAGAHCCTATYFELDREATEDQAWNGANALYLACGQGTDVQARTTKYVTGPPNTTYDPTLYGYPPNYSGPGSTRWQMSEWFGLGGQLHVHAMSGGRFDTGYATETLYGEMGTEVGIRRMFGQYDASFDAATVLIKVVNRGPNAITVGPWC
jgi:hypothetical protein